MWLQRLSPDARDGVCSLSASASTADMKVVTVDLSPVEAALAVSVALRHFWREVVLVPGGDRPALGPSRSRAAELYLRALPVKEYLSYGLEGPYTASNENEGSRHSALEQIAWNLRDCVLSHAPQEEYRFYDANPEELDAALLAAIYVTRARVLRLRAILCGDSAADRVTSVIAPTVDFLNHSPNDYTCAACVAMPKRVVVVRAARDINVGEELTLNYRGPVEEQRVLAREGAEGFFSGEEMDSWESRYLFSADDA